MPEVEPTPEELRAAGLNGHDAPALKQHRVLPQSQEAEKGLICSIMLQPREVCAHCAAKGITEDHFSNPSFALIYKRAMQMWEKNEPIDFVTLGNCLASNKEIDRCGGHGQLAALFDYLPTAANYPTYLEILEEKAALRQVLSIANEYGTRVYQDSENPWGLIDDFEQEVMAIRHKRGRIDIVPPKQLVIDAVGKIEMMYQRRGEVTGIPTGYPVLDKMLDGLHPTNLTVIAARPAMGKAQPYSAMVQTPEGPRLMSSLKVGDYVIGLNGKPTRVSGIFPQGRKKVYRVKLSDGSETRCCGEHLWLTQTRNERRNGGRWSVKDTEEILRTLKRPDGGNFNHIVPRHSAVEFTQLGDLPLHPWLLGALIGDGKLSNSNPCFFKPENDLQERVISLLPEWDTATRVDGGLRIRKRTNGNSLSITAQAIKALGLNTTSDQKFIPLDYLFASVNDRWDLLRGLIDTDGSIVGSIIEYSTSSERLARDVMFLLRSLGVMAIMQSRIPKYQYLGENLTGKRSFRLFIQYQTASELPFTSQKHHSRHKPSGRHQHRSIASITEDGEEECQCIKVEAEDSIYLTDDFIPTHNTALAMNIAEHLALDQKKSVGVFSLEMSRDQLIQRMICSRAKIDLARIRDGFLSERDFPAIQIAASHISASKIWIDDTSNLSIQEMRGRARVMKMQYGIDALFVDYLQLARSTSKSAQNSREREVAEISNGLKALAKELHIPVVVLAQLKRNADAVPKGTYPRPRLSDLRESGAIEQDADEVLLITRDEYYADPNDEEEMEEVRGKATIIVAKQRNGPTGDVPMTFLRQYARFESRSFSQTDEEPASQGSLI